MPRQGLLLLRWPKQHPAAQMTTSSDTRTMAWLEIPVGTLPHGACALWQQLRTSCAGQAGTCWCLALEGAAALGLHQASPPPHQRDYLQA